MDTAKNVTVVLLVLAFIVSSYILMVDNILWEDNPKNYHAYGLIAFAIVDLVLLGLTLSKPTVARTGTLIWGILQTVVLIGDAATGLGLGISPSVATSYLFLGEGGGLKNPSGISVSVLLVLYVALAVTSVWGRRAQGRT